MWTLEPEVLLAAALLDFLIGDPRGWPHVTRGAGAVITRGERLLRRLGWDGIGGGFLLAGGAILALLLPALLLHHLLGLVWAPLAFAGEVLIVYQCLAYRDLIRHARAVAGPLLAGDLQTARAKVGWIVGRDTDQLDETEVSRAAVEAVAESTNDGVLAPLFWAVVLGPAGALIFRLANTLDSMVGHRDEQYERLGKASARLDDVLGFIPARISALALLAVCGRVPSRAMAADARRHASPNAGWPESALAHGLNLRLGGLNHYDGEPHPGPRFHPSGPPPAPTDIARACDTLTRAYALALGLACLGSGL